MPVDFPGKKKNTRASVSFGWLSLKGNSKKNKTRKGATGQLGNNKTSSFPLPNKSLACRVLRLAAREPAKNDSLKEVSIPKESMTQLFSDPGKKGTLFGEDHF